MVKLKRPTQHYPLVEIWWDDAAGLRHGWQSKEDPLEAQMVLSVGFLIAENDEHIIIAQDIDPSGMHNGRSQIPKGMLRNLVYLRPKKKKELVVESPSSV